MKPWPSRPICLSRLPHDGTSGCPLEYLQCRDEALSSLFPAPRLDWFNAAVRLVSVSAAVAAAADGGHIEDQLGAFHVVHGTLQSSQVDTCILCFSFNFVSKVQFVGQSLAWKHRFRRFFLLRVGIRFFNIILALSPEITRVPLVMYCCHRLRLSLENIGFWWQQ